MSRAVDTIRVGIALLSAVLAICAVTAGAASYVRSDKFEYVSPAGRMVLVISRNGRMDVMHRTGWTGDPGFTHIPSSTTSTGATDYGRRLLGIGGGMAPSGARYVNIPYWLPAGLFVLWPAIVIPGVLRRRRASRGLCPTCGYDLRASPDRCPECGTARAA